MALDTNQRVRTRLGRLIAPAAVATGLGVLLGTTSQNARRRLAFLSFLESRCAYGVIGVVAWTFVGLIVLMSANGAEVEGASTLLQQDWSELSDVRKLPRERIDSGLAARLLAFAGIGQDRCGLGPFPTWALIKRYSLRERDFKVTVKANEQSGDGAIGPYYQLMLDAEDEAARMLGERGVAEGCLLIRNELSRHVKIGD
jgi:hypothetical protein